MHGEAVVLEPLTARVQLSHECRILWRETNGASARLGLRFRLVELFNCLMLNLLQFFKASLPLFCIR